MTKNSPGIRIATTDDIDTLCTLDEIAATNSKRVEFIQNSINKNSCWVIESDNILIGYAVVQPDFFDYEFISMLYLTRDYRKKGFGLVMLNHLESICKTDKLFSSTNQSNIPAQKLLTKAGFVRSGQIDNLDNNDPELIYFKMVNNK